MTRYHINPKTGNPGVCKAKVKCRFGDITKDHYPTKELARKAYERKMSGEALQEIYKNSPMINTLKETGNTTIPISEVNKIIVSEFIKKYTVNNFKRDVKATVTEEEKIEKYTSSAQKLFNNFLIPMGEPFGGSFLAPTRIEGEYQLSARLDNTVEKIFPNSPIYGDFKFIGCGVEANVYLNEKEEMVYKIPNSYISNNSGIWDSDKAASKQLEAKVQKRIYDALNRGELGEDNIEYAETYFLKVKDKHGIEVPIMAQKYLPPAEYDSFIIPKKLKEKITASGLLIDLHNENVYINKSNGKILLIDCINSWKDEEFNSLI